MGRGGFVTARFGLEEQNERKILCGIAVRGKGFHGNASAAVRGNAAD